MTCVFVKLAQNYVGKVHMISFRAFACVLLSSVFISCVFVRMRLFSCVFYAQTDPSLAVVTLRAFKHVWDYTFDDAIALSAITAPADLQQASHADAPLREQATQSLVPHSTFYDAGQRDGPSTRTSFLEREGAGWPVTPPLTGSMLHSPTEFPCGTTWTICIP